jgi:hypothetical protein
MYGYRFTKPSLWLDPKEYGKILSEINGIYYIQYGGKKLLHTLHFGLMEKHIFIGLKIMDLTITIYS